MNLAEIIASARSAERYSPDLAAKVRAIAGRVGRAQRPDPCPRCGSVAVITSSAAPMCALCGSVR